MMALLGTLASIGGLLFGWIQNWRLERVKRRANTDIWQALTTTRAIMAKLEATGKLKTDPATAEVYGKVTELFRHLLRTAVLDEKHYSEETIRNWRSAGKLSSGWQEDQARQFLDTAAINSGVAAGAPARLPERPS